MLGKYSRQMYNTSAWRKIRLIHLDEFPLCYICQKHDKIKVANHVDHIIPVTKLNYSKMFLNLDNYQSLCSSCHSIVTLKQKGILWDRLTYKEAQARKLELYVKPIHIGLDGYPIE